LFNSTEGKLSKDLKFKPGIFNQAMEIDYKAVKQETVYKQQLMAHAQTKNNVSLSIIVTSAEREPLHKNIFNIVP
jgi:hypothetical protein